MEVGYLCEDCRKLESWVEETDGFDEFRARWNDPVEYLTPQEKRDFAEERARWEEAEARAFTWPVEKNPTPRAERAAHHRENLTWTEIHHSIVAGDRVPEPLPALRYDYPVDPETTRQVLANPDDDSPRRDYVTWLRTFEGRGAQGTADFVEAQLDMAAAFRRDARSDMRSTLRPRLFGSPQHVPSLVPWWRVPGLACDSGARFEGTGLLVPMLELEREGLVDQCFFYRGFVEHVAMKAERFLELADELFSLAPIRYLTITYAKGKDHTSQRVWHEFLSSPYLERIRALKLPRRIAPRDTRYTELNRFSDADIRLLAQSPRLSNLRLLDLEDASILTGDAFDALAEYRRNLRALSLVRHDMHLYTDGLETPWGIIGKPGRKFHSRPLRDYAERIEARHGHQVWLHPLDYYGTEDPDPEAVVEHPVALLRK
jgi:hypothetical protein